MLATFRTSIVNLARLKEHELKITGYSMDQDALIGR